MIGGILSSFVSEWHTVTSDPFIHEIITGYQIPFTATPVQRNEPKCREFSTSEKLALTELICDYLRMGAISMSTEEPEQFLSTIFPIPKSDGSNRLIFNLAPLNEFIAPSHFKLEDYRSVRALLVKDGFMGKIDIRHAYLHVPIHLNCRKFLKFRWQGVLYQFDTLPFGLSLAPWVFTKLMRPVMTFLREQGYQNSIFLDDIWIHNDTREKCYKNINQTIRLLQKLGFLINFEKRLLTPTQNIEYLGFIFDTVQFRISLPLKKQDKLRKLCAEALSWGQVTIREMSVLLGSLISAAPAVTYAMMYTRQMAVEESIALKYSNRNYEARTSLSESVKADVRWWLKALDSPGQAIRYDYYDFEMSTDSSDTGWGAKLGNRRCSGFWPTYDQQFHINIKELKAILNALMTLLPNVFNVSILLRVDNQVAISYVNKLGGCHCPTLLSIAKAIWHWAEVRRVWLFASYIGTKDNWEADAESRKELQSNDWCLSQDYFHEICSSFGVPEIDLFATNVSRKCVKFCSFKPCPGASYVDAFTISWSNMRFYCFPPFVLITRVLRKIKSEKARGIIVVPLWPSQNWYPLFIELCCSRFIILGPCKSLLTCPYSSRPHPLWPKLKLAAALI